MKILLAITFIYGVVRLLTFTKLFNTQLVGILNSIIPYDEKSTLGEFFHLLSTWFFYFSLIFQAWFWIFSKISL